MVVSFKNSVSSVSYVEGERCSILQADGPEDALSLPKKVGKCGFACASDELWQSDRDCRVLCRNVAYFRRKTGTIGDN